MPFVDVRLHDRKLTRELVVFDKISEEVIPGNKKIVAVHTEEGWYEHYVVDSDGMLVMERPNVPKCERVKGSFELRHRDGTVLTEQPQKVK